MEWINAGTNLYVTFDDPAVDNATERARDPQVAIDGHGTVVVAYSYTADGLSSRVEVRGRPPGAARFGPPQRLSGSDVGEHPRLAVDGSGTMLAVWAERNGLRFAERPSGGVFGTAQTLASVSGPVSDVTLAMNDAGAAVVSWNDGVGGIFVSVRPAGGSFAPAERPPGFDHGSRTAVVIDPAGNVLAALLGQDGRVLHSYRPTGTAFGPPTAISPAGQTASRPRLAVDRRGHVLAVWAAGTDPSPTTRQVQAAYRPAGDTSQFQSPVQVSDVGGADPCVAMDRQGTATVAWHRQNRIHTKTRPAGSSATFANNQIASGAGDAADLPTIAISGASDVALMWRARGSGPMRIEAAARPAGAATFAPPVVLYTAPPSLSVDSLQIAAAADGRAAAVWARPPDVGAAGVILAAVYGDPTGEPTSFTHPAAPEPVVPEPVIPSPPSPGIVTTTTTTGPATGPTITLNGDSTRVTITITIEVPAPAVHSAS